MANKIIGFFQNADRAQQVEDDLIEAGFDRADIHRYAGKDEPSLWDHMREWFGYAEEEDRHLYHEAARRGGVAVVCETADDDIPAGEKAARIMQRHNPIDLDRQSAQWRKEGWEGYKGPVPQPLPRQPAAQQPPTTRPAPAPAQPPAPASETRGETESIPVVEEQLRVSKRAILQGGVRIHSHVVERPVEERVDLREEHVEVERRPADRPVRPGERAFEERTVEATETTEKPVVSKETKVVEEINVRKDVAHRTETVRDTVRKTDVDVEKVSGERPGTTAPGTTPASSERGFDASRFVADMDRDRRYQGKTWDACEADFRRSYEQRYPQSKWESVRDRVRSEYNRTHSRA